VQISNEIKAGADSLQKLLKIVNNINQRYGGKELGGLRSGQVRSLVRNEQRILMAGEAVPFDLIPSDQARAGGTCCVLKIKMGGKIFAMKRLNAEVSLEAFRREVGVLRDLSHIHIPEVFGSIIDTNNRLKLILSPWCEVLSQFG